MQTTVEPTPGVRFLARPHLLTSTLIDAEVPEGQTLGQILDASGLDPAYAQWTRVHLDGAEIPPSWWDRTRPRAGTIVTATVTPMGGGGGDGNKTTRTVLTIVVLIAAVVLQQYYAVPAAGAALTAGNVAWGIGTAVGAAAALLAINALLPPPKPRRADQDGTGLSPSIAGSRNVANPWGIIPVILGRHRCLA